MITEDQVQTIVNRTMLLSYKHGRECMARGLFAGIIIGGVLGAAIMTAIQAT